MSSVSSRFTPLPAIFQSFGSLSLSSCGGSSFAAAAATLPKLIVCPDFACEMTLFAALHSAAGTFHSAAAAAISMIRAAAPALRTYSFDSRMPRLPPVEKLPQTRLRATFSPGVGYSVVTFDQSHSSSSATSWARPVSVPCPISERAMRMITVSSGLITTQALISGGIPGGRSAAPAAAAPHGMRKPSERPPPIAATPPRNERRASFGICVISASYLMPWPQRGSPRAPAGRCRSDRYW